MIVRDFCMLILTEINEVYCSRIIFQWWSTNIPSKSGNFILFDICDISFNIFSCDHFSAESNADVFNVKSQSSPDGDTWIGLSQCTQGK